MSGNKTLFGACCSCQRSHRVVPRGLRLEELDEIGEGESQDMYDDAAGFVMAPHMMNGDSGPWCDGAGTVPQALVRQQ